MTSSHCFYDITSTVFDIIPTVSVPSRPLYWWYHTNWIFEISSAIYDDIISIVYDITATECVSSHPPFQRYNTLCMQDITPTLCIKSYTLYKAPHPHFMTSHHTIYDIISTVFMTSPSLYLKWHLPYLGHHNDSIDGLTPTVYMTSHPPYVCHLMHSTQRHIHSLLLYPIVFITLHPLHSWHHTPYIWHHTHGNTNVICAIWPAISNTKSTVSVSSNTGYQLYHSHSLYDITHTIRVTSYSVCMLSQEVFMTLHPSMYNITPSIFMT